MDVLTLSQECAEHYVMNFRLGLLVVALLSLELLNLFLAPFLPALLQRQVKVKVKDLWVVLCEVLAATNLRVLEHVEHVHRLLGKGLAKAVHELLRVC